MNTQIKTSEEFTARIIAELEAQGIDRQTAEQVAAQKVAELFERSSLMDLLAGVSQHMDATKLAA